jgi:cysteinyl-tRNA synthetase
LNTVDRLIEAHAPANQDNLLPDVIAGIQSGFREAVMDNFNTAKVIAGLSDLFTRLNTFITSKKPKMKQKVHTLKLFREEFRVIADVLGIFDEDPETFINEYKNRFLEENDISLREIEEKIAARAEAKKNKDYETADGIRAGLSERKIMLQDTPQGVEWDVILD